MQGKADEHCRSRQMRDAMLGICAMLGTADALGMSGQLHEPSPDRCTRKDQLVARSMAGTYARQGRADARVKAG
jgi:hypothetical protein